MNRMYNRSMIKALIFDYDGVINNGDLARFRFFQQAFQQHKSKLDSSLFPQTMGKTTKEVFDQVIDKTIPNKIKQAVLDDYHTQYKKQSSKYLLPITPTIEFIKDYQGEKKLAVTSNTGRDLVFPGLRQFGIDRRLALVVTKEMVACRKPNPEIYLLTLKKLQLDKSEAIVIEDSPVGVSAATQAGISCYVFLSLINSQSDFVDTPVCGFIHSKEDYRKLADRL